MKLATRDLGIGLRFAVGLAISLSIVSGCAARAPAVAIDRADIRINLLLDGSVEVRETLTVRSGPAATTFLREIPHDRVDDFIDISAWIGDRRLPEGDGAGHAAVTRGRSLRVRWPIGPSQTLTLQYRATGVLALDGTRGVLAWNARPAPLGESMGPTHIELTAPPQTVFVTPPSVSGSGWVTSATGDRWVADKPGIGANEPIVVAAEVAADSLALAESSWQYRTARAREFMPAFIACGPFLLIVGAGVLGLMRVQYPPLRAHGGEPERAAAPVLTPGLASSLSHDLRGPAWRLIQAAVSGLIARGVVQVADRTEGEARRGVVTVRQASGLDGHAQLVADELWLAARDGRLDLASATRTLRQIKSLRLRRAVLADLSALGLVDAERAAAARGLRVAGLVVIGLGVVLFGLSPLAFDAFGIWLLVIPASFVLVGAVFVAAASRFPVLTAAGWRAREDARRRRAELDRMERCLESPSR